MLRYAAVGAGALLSPVGFARGAVRGPLLSDVRLMTRRPFDGDRASLATVGTAAGRQTVRLQFVLGRTAEVSFDTLVTGQGLGAEQLAEDAAQQTVGTRTLRLGPGRHVLDWAPDVTLQPRTYLLRLRVVDGAGVQAAQRTVVRVLGIDAGFRSAGVAAGDIAVLSVGTDAQQFAVQLLHCGAETEPTYANDELKGVPVTEPIAINWARNADRCGTIRLRIGADWPSGVYAARLETDDGRIGFAPLVVRPAAPQHRVAVVMPTSTWQAYNFYDADGDGWGDTWYARWRRIAVDTTRPHANRGVPYRFRSYDLQFLRWLVSTGRQVDFYADEDLERFGSAADLRAAYDLIAFPGHTEYVSTQLYDLIAGYRDAGGNLMFLSANNFFRRVDRGEGVVLLVDEWRSLDRPEATLCGVQYVAGDRGERHAAFTVTGLDVAPWAFEGTGLKQGAQFGMYGIEIDALAWSSPPNTQVLARIPDLFGPGKSAEMTYYEHESGARVFSAGALNFGGQMLLWPEATRIVENVWQRLGGPPAVSPPT
ncbi:MAG TPA: N,N-dimethylformamidase beta subunit family domain-containing protein [Gaiellaceae bacterium]